jgi:hypothetical protein
MTSCELLGMHGAVREYQSAFPQLMFGDGRAPKDKDQHSLGESPLKKQKRLLKRIDGQLTSLTRIVILLIVIDVIRMLNN